MNKASGGDGIPVDLFEILNDDSVKCCTQFARKYYMYVCVYIYIYIYVKPQPKFHILFQILKDEAVKVLHSICQQIWKTQQWPQD